MFILNACSILAFLFILCCFHGAGMPTEKLKYTNVHSQDKHVIKTDNISNYYTHYLEVPKFLNDILLSTPRASVKECSLQICYHLFLMWQKSTTCDPKIFFRVLTLALRFSPNEWVKLTNIKYLQERAIETEKNVREDWYRTKELDEKYSDFDSTKLSKICSQDCLEKLIASLEELYNKQYMRSARRMTPDLTFKSCLSTLKVFLVALIGSEKHLKEFRYFAHPLIVFALINYNNMSVVSITPKATYVKTTVDIYHCFIGLKETMDSSYGSTFKPPKDTLKEKKDTKDNILPSSI